MLGRRFEVTSLRLSGDVDERGDSDSSHDGGSPLASTTPTTSLSRCRRMLPRTRPGWTESTHETKSPQFDNACPIYSPVESIRRVLFDPKTWKIDILSKIFITVGLPFDQVFHQYPVDNYTVCGSNNRPTGLGFLAAATTAPYVAPQSCGSGDQPLCPLVGALHRTHQDRAFAN
jgi:hypothetical protein